ncbi:MAG: type II secretion system protein [Planctomycetota bacterium]
MTKMDRRRGHSLIELLVVIGTGGALMGIAVGLLSMLLRVDQHSRDQMRERTEIHRLADQFRRDVHAADGFTVQSPPGAENAAPAWQLPLGAGHVVQYQAEPGELLRTEREGDQVLRQESFFLPAGTTVSIDLAGEAAPGIVSLRIPRDGNQPPGSTWRGLSVDAALAKDRRFAKPNQP